MYWCQTPSQTWYHVRGYRCHGRCAGVGAMAVVVVGTKAATRSGTKIQLNQVLIICHGIKPTLRDITFTLADIIFIFTNMPQCKSVTNNVHVQ